MSTMDTCQSSLTRNPACWQLSTVPLEDTISCDSPLASSLSKTSSRRRWTRSSRSAKDASESQMTSLSMSALRQNTTPAYKISSRLPANTIWCLTHKNTCEGLSHQFLWLPLWCWWCPPKPRKGGCCTLPISDNKHHQTPRVPMPSHIP